MLVLSRKPRELIRIGDDITITIVRIADNKVRIGIQAPANVPVHREEVYHAIKQAAKDQTTLGLTNTGDETDGNVEARADA